jgi:N-carbamoylputrescine amidase
MPGRSVRVAAVQIECKHGLVRENHAHALPFVEHAARDGAELIALPELFASGYFLNEHLLEFGETAGGATEQWLCAAAKGLHVYLGAGFVERNADDFFNCWALAGPDGAVIGRTRKTFTEYALFAAGPRESHVMDTPLGRIGVGICADNHRSILPRLMQSSDIDLMLMPHAWPLPFRTTRHVSEGDIERSVKEAVDWPSLYARILGVPAVFVNQVGPFGPDRWDGLIGRLFTPEAFRFGGLSAIVDSDGAVKGRLDQAEEGFIVADVTLDDLRKVTQHPPDHSGYLTRPATLGVSVFRHVVVPLASVHGRFQYQRKRLRHRRMHRPWE